MSDPIPSLPAFQAVLDREKQRESSNIYRFPIWPEPERGTPNEFSRSALFLQASKQRIGNH